MAWQMPGQWNSGVPQMTPDLSMGSYTPEQWAVVQQQNWQQWTQWQQQYSQWQNQYGEKYAQQMQSMHVMGMAPPLPTANTAPPPAPPPPEKPPPPPHENNQPLFGQPNPVPAPGLQQKSQHTGSSNNVNIPTGSTQNWQQGSEMRQDAFQPTVNAEALKKLAEEERLFDIQFEKWEEEIQKWKKDNVNHPDRQAYNEYEQKFETCRAQLLERRQVMKQKRAKLLGQTVPAAGAAPTGNPSTAPPLQNAINNHKLNMQSQSNNSPASGQTSNQYRHQDHPQNNYRPNNTKMPQNFNNNTPQNYQDNSQYGQYNNNMQSQSGYNNRSRPSIDPQDRYDSYQAPEMEEESYSKPITNTNFLPGTGSAKSIPGLDLVPEDKEGQQTEVIDITGDRPAAGDKPPDYTTISKGINSILGDEKIMNILSLVRDQGVPIASNEQVSYSENPPQNSSANKSNAPPNNQWDRNQPTPNQQYGDTPSQQFGNQPNQQYGNPPNQQYGNPPNQQYGNPPNQQYGNPPNQQHGNTPHQQYDTPSQKFGNQPNQQYGNPPNQQYGNPPNQQYGNTPHQQYGNTPHQHGNAPNQQYVNTPNQQYGNQSNQQYGNMPSQQYGNAPSNKPFNRRGPGYSDQPEEQHSQQYPPQRGRNNDRENNPSGDSYNDRNMQAQNMHPRGPLIRPNVPNMPPPRPLMQETHGYGDDNTYNRRPPPTGPPDNMRPMRPNMPPPRPLMQGVPGYENENDYNRAAPDTRRTVNPTVNPVLNSQVAPPPPPSPARLKWVDETLFTPSIIVEYEHKPLRLKAREFIEPVHMFDYNHKSKDGENNKKIDFEREADELFQRKPRRYEPEDGYRENRFAADDPYKENRFAPDQGKDYKPRDYERRYPREELRNDYRNNFRDQRDDYRDRVPPREEYDDRRRLDDRFDERRRDDRDRFARREDFTRDRGRDREDSYRDRQRDSRRDDNSNRSRSHDRDTRKRARSKESTVSESSSTKKSKEPDNKPASDKPPKHIVMIDDLLEPPGREMRPEKIVIILRGPPGSGKSYLAKLIRDREAEHGGTARIMSIDDYFMQEGEIEEKDPATGKIIKKPSLKYEYEAASEETYLNSLKRAFKRSLTDGYFNFLIYDAINDTLRSYADIWNFARQQGFQVYICTMELDSQICLKRNIHGRTLGDIQVVCTRFFPTPDHHIQLDATTLLQSGAITEVDMEDMDDEVVMEDVQDPEGRANNFYSSLFYDTCKGTAPSQVESSFTSKWEKLDDAVQLARLDGTSKPLRPSQLSMEDYLQLDDWKPTTAKPGKKTVRWADIEESRQQEKMRAIGFVVGQTDWNRMTDPTKGSSALTQTKYIERVRRN